MKSFWLIPLFLLLFTATNPSPAFACSGGGSPTIIDDINDAELIVKGHVVESDDLQTNAIIQVESYISGMSQGEYLFVQGTDAQFARAQTEDLPRVPCAYLSFIPMRRSAYFFLGLSSTGTGIYQIFGSYDFETATSLDLFFPDPNDPIGAIKNAVNEPEFLELIAELKNSNPKPPIANDTTYPAKSLLAVLTSTGKQYFLPIDGTPPVEMTPVALTSEELFEGITLSRLPIACMLPQNCPGLSPDRFHLIWVFPDEAEPTFLFSPTSDRVAVWEDDKIVLQPLIYPRFGSTGYEESRSTVNIDLNLGEDSDVEILIHSAAWSPDGRWFAYSDLDGLWLKNVIASDDPARLLIPTENGEIPTARYFSPQSHYLAYTHGEQRATLDISSGAQFPDGLVSPDDRTLLAFDLERNPTEIQICIFETRECSQNAPTNYMYQYFDDLNEGLNTPLAHNKRVEWADTHSFFVLACHEDDPILCGVSQHEFTYYGYGFAGSPSILALDYAYQPASDEIAYLVDGSTVIWNDQDRDLSASIDGEITDIQWLSPEFYYEP